MEKPTTDPESGTARERIPHWQSLIDQGVLTPEILKWQYDGSGTEEDPYAVTWIDHDPRDPKNFTPAYKWVITLGMAGAVLGVAFCSSAYSGGVAELMREYRASQEVVTLGLSLFVLGFAVGPLFFAPLSELYGRQILFAVTFGLFAFFNAGATGAQNIWSVCILRFFAGTFGSSPLTNAGGVIADLFGAKERGLAMSIFAAAPFLGPVVGPIVGGFVGQTIGWRWLLGIMAAFSGFLWIAGMLLAPETYAPVLLRKRAAALSKRTGKVYRSKADLDQGTVTIGEALKTALLRPWILLFREPIVLILSLYLSIIYGTLYLLFGAYPIVYQRSRGWSQGIGGLAFIGVAIGMFFAVVYSIVFENKRYLKRAKENGGYAEPEARLPSSIIGGIALPIGLFWFAWTNSPSVHWAVSMAAGIPFGFGMVLVFLSIMNYLIDSYTIYAASVLAANAVLRSLFGASFPLFTTQMYAELGIHWASAIPAFLALACVPFPFIFYKYGRSIRLRSKYAAQADAFMAKLRGQAGAEADSDDNGQASDPEKELAKDGDIERAEAGGEAVDHTRDAEDERIHGQGGAPHFERIKTGRSVRSAAQSEYDFSPYDIDRVNTRESFPERPRRPSRAGSLSAKKSKT